MGSDSDQKTMLFEHTTDRTMILSDGRTLGYAEYGSSSGRPIILFHGTPGSRLSGAIFDSVSQSHNARIIVADRPGYATSSPRRDATLLGYIDDIIALVNSLQFDKFAVLGVSGGAPFALACAAKIPQRIISCGLMSAIGPLSVPHSMDGMATVNRIFFTLGRFLPALVGTILPAQVRSSMKAVQKYLDEDRSPMAEVSPVIFRQLIADQLEAVRAGGKGITFDMTLLTRDWGFRLEDIQARVYMWHGADDNLAPVALAQYVAEYIPGCVIKYIPKAGHAGTFACADEVMKVLV